MVSPLNGYGTGEVAQILGLSPGQVRGYVRAGLVSPERGPRGQFRFSFPDLAFLRTARGLLDARIPQRRIRRALRLLARDLPDPAGLRDVKIASDGGRIVARDETMCWQPESGQAVFDFESSGRSGVLELPPHLEPVRDDGADRSGPEWYDLACELETEEPDRAIEAYARALRLDPELSDAHVNLGRLLHERGEPAAARAHYLAALAVRSDDATAAFNLGVALEDLGDDAEALASYERAIALNPVDSDACFNAANLCERLDDREAALRHWNRYRALTRESR